MNIHANDSNPLRSSYKELGNQTPIDLLKGKSNKNLLDNWDFRNPVNQRGAASYTSAGITIDRWKMGACTLTLQDGGLTFGDLPDAGQNFYQTLEKPSVLSGETVTLSFLCSGSGQIILGYKTADSTSMIYRAANFSHESVAIAKYTYTFPADITYLAVYIKALANETHVKAAKLELGPVSTLVNDPPMDYNMELEKCQRYFKRFYPTAGNFLNVGQLFATGENAGWLILDIPNMRTKPSVSLSDMDKVIAMNITVGNPISTGLEAFAYSTIYRENSLWVGSRFIESNFEVGKTYLMWIADSDCYLDLSADL